MIDLAALGEELALARARTHEFVLFGSVVLLIHGLRYGIGDIDLFVRPALYHRLREQGWREHWPQLGDPPVLEEHVAGKPAHAFRDWTHRDPHVDVGACFRFSEMIGGWPCVPLWIVRAQKAGALSISAHWSPEYAARVHGKHAVDLEGIDRRLGRAA